MKKRGKVLFIQCIKSSCEDFLTKQHGYKVKIDLDVLKIHCHKESLRETELLFQVPFYVLLDPSSPTFRLIYYPVVTESFIEAMIFFIVLGQVMVLSISVL